MWRAAVKEPLQCQATSNGAATHGATMRGPRPAAMRRTIGVAHLNQACFLVVTRETAPMAGAKTSHSPMVTTIEVT